MRKWVRGLKWICNFAYFFTAWWFFFSLNAHAYIDPSAVTYVIQAIAAVFVAIGALLTVFRHRIAKVFRKEKKIEKREIHVEEDSTYSEGKTEDK